MTAREHIGKRKKSPAFFLMSHQHISSNDRSALWRKMNPNYPKRVKTVQNKNLLSFDITYSLALTPWLPSQKDRKIISRLGAFFLKKRIRLKESKTREGYHWAHFSCYLKFLFSLVLFCFSTIKVEMWIPVKIKEKAIYLCEEMKNTMRIGHVARFFFYNTKHLLTFSI